MKKPFLALTLLLPCLLCGAEPERTEEKKQEEKPKVVRPLDMTPEELSQATEDYYEKVLKKDIKVSPAEREELFAAHGPVVRKQLIKNFSEAKSIVFTEISHKWDFEFPKGAAPAATPAYEYESVTLTDEQRKNALVLLEAMDGTSGRAKAVCFYPHHRLDMVNKDGRTSRILICRECNRTEWDGLRLDSPGKITRVFTEIMKSAGLDLSKDWSKVAMERWAKEQATDGGPDKGGTAK